MKIKNRLRQILPMAINFELKNIKQYFHQEEITLPVVSGSRVFFCDAATYNNLGDQAIAYAMSLYLTDLVGKEKYVEIPQSKILNYWKFLRNNVKQNDVICLSGGGNMGDLYPRFEAIRRKIIKAFPNNKIVIFPQTIDYSHSRYGVRELKKSAIVYNANPNLFVCAREIKSLDLMSTLYKNVILVPDIVIYLRGRIKLTEKCKNYKVGLCLRDDAESTLSRDDKKTIYQQIVDAGYEVDFITTMSEEGENFYNSIERLKALSDKLNEFNRYNTIITDRLHGMIFSVISNTRCLAINNSNGKVFGVLENANLENYDIKKVENIHQIAEFLKESVSDKQLGYLPINMYKSLENVLQIKKGG